MPRLTSPFILDLRSIALFRILIGSIMLYDLFARFSYIELYMTDAGALSRIDLLAVTDRPWSFSIYMLFGNAIQVQAMFLFHALAAIALVVGFRTRIASVVCWFMLISLQHRNPLILNGGDTLFAVYAFWAIFLPMNARWSIDRVLTSDASLSNRFHSIPGAAFMAQTLFVYIFTVLLKSGDLWKNGEAVSYVVRNIGLIKGGGVWLQQFNSAQSLITYLTYHWEWFGCVLILLPLAGGRIRTISIFGYVLMHLSFALTLDLALFPIVSGAGCLALLPTSFWTGLKPVAAKLNFNEWASNATQQIRSLPLKGGACSLPGKSAAICCATAIVFVLAWNIRGLPDSFLKRHFPEPIKNALYTVKLRQKWGMFAANPPQSSSWYAIEAQLANGSTVDLFYPQEPYTLRPPTSYTDRFPDRRWGKFLGNLKKKKYKRLRNDYLEYFMNRWNERVAFKNKIQSASLVLFRQKIMLDGSSSKTTTRKLDTVWLETVNQVKHLPSEPVETAEEDLQDI